jgi:hypothetical protein
MELAQTAVYYKKVMHADAPIRVVSESRLVSGLVSAFIESSWSPLECRPEAASAGARSFPGSATSMTDASLNLHMNVVTLTLRRPCLPMN